MGISSGLGGYTSPGLILIQTQEVTAQQNVDFIDVFRDQYSGYKLIWDYTQNTSTGDLYFNFRDSSGVMTGNHYTHMYGGGYASSGTAAFGAFSLNTTPTNKSYIGSGAVAANSTSGFLEIQNPQGTNPVFGQGQASSLNYSATLTYVFLSGGFLHNTNATRTGFRLSTNVGTMTGKFSLYGYRN